METRRLTEYNEVRNATLAGRFRTWQTLLRDLKRTANRDHTVVRFPNASSYLFSASHEEDFPMVEAFCRFMLQCRPGVLFLTHLREVSRGLDSMWLPRHAAMVRARLSELAPETVVSVPCPGDVLTLSKPFRHTATNHPCTEQFPTEA